MRQLRRNPQVPDLALVFMSSMSVEENPEGHPPASPLTRIGEARWILLTALCAALAAVLLFNVPFWPAAAAVGLMTGVAAFVPRRSASRRVKLNTQREIRRMWPGTGMKVTVDALPTPCFVADGRGITRYVNAKAHAIYEGVKARRSAVLLAARTVAAGSVRPCLQHRQGRTHLLDRKGADRNLVRSAYRTDLHARLCKFRAHPSPGFHSGGDPGSDREPASGTDADRLRRQCQS